MNISDKTASICMTIIIAFMVIFTLMCIGDMLGHDAPTTLDAK